MSNKIDTIIKRPWDPSDVSYWVNPNDKTTNATIIYNDKLTRLRAGMLVIKNGTAVLLGEEADEPGVFSLPGGSIECGETIVEAASREVREEVKLKTKNIRDTGIDYCECHETVAPWVAENIPEEHQWYNYYTCLTIGDIDGEYKGKIDAVDLDSSMKATSKFYEIDTVLHDASFKKAWKLALYKFGYITRNQLTESLMEDTRTAQISKSKNVGTYRDRSRGKNRWERKKYSKIGNAVKQYNSIDMNNLFKKDLLQVDIPVVGETNSYTVTVKMEGVIAEIQRNIKNNKNKLEFRTIVQSLTKIFNTADVYTKCTCDDFKYTYMHTNIVNNVSVDDTSKDPGPGKNIRNANDDKGRGCKHILLVLNNGDWMIKVASVINNYIHYAEEHLQKPFLKVIFPKLYGVAADTAVEADLLDDDKYLDSSKGMIDAINEYGRNRGKYKPGTNRNPINDKRNKKDEAESSEESEDKQ